MLNTENFTAHHSTILIFGGSGIIGRAIAMKFGQQGWSVGIHCHKNFELAAQTAAAISSTPGTAQVYPANIRQPSQVKDTFTSFLQDYGSLTILVWAVGVATSKLLVKTSSKEWADSIQTNLTGAFYVLQEAGPIFEKQGKGAVVLIGSLSGEQGIKGQTAYASSKAGLIGLMQTTAQEWGNSNIRVNAIFPGWHSSPLSKEGLRSSDERQPHVLGHQTSVEQVAESVYHLASTQNISGQIWNLDSRIW